MLYLVVIIDWYSSYALSWEIKDSIEIDFVLEACKTALKDVKTEIMNSVQGSLFTNERYTELFLNAGAKISIDHRGKAYDSPKEARIGINRYIEYYNRGRPHSVLKYKTPETVYKDKR